MIFEALEGEIIVVESYTLEKQNGSLKFFIDGEEVDWKWRLNNPSWDWIKEKGKWTHLKKQDEWFLSEFGFSDLFSEFGVKYINITEEIWQGRAMNKNIVKEVVEGKFSPVYNEKLYQIFPKVLNKYNNGIFISLGKVKGIKGSYPSLTLKNMFGLIPDPLRSWWHGPADKFLSRNIIDLNKVYHAFFNVYGICEAINSAIISNPKGSIKTSWGNYDVLKNLGFAWSSNNLISLDSVLCVFMDINPKKIEYIKLAEKDFGNVDKNVLKIAKIIAKEIFYKIIFI